MTGLAGLKCLGERHCIIASDLGGELYFVERPSWRLPSFQAKRVSRLADRDHSQTRGLPWPTTNVRLNRGSLVSSGR